MGQQFALRLSEQEIAVYSASMRGTTMWRHRAALQHASICATTPFRTRDNTTSLSQIGGPDCYKTRLQVLPGVQHTSNPTRVLGVAAVDAIVASLAVAILDVFVQGQEQPVKKSF